MSRQSPRPTSDDVVRIGTTLKDLCQYPFSLTLTVGGWRLVVRDVEVFRRLPPGWAYYVLAALVRWEEIKKP